MHILSREPNKIRAELEPGLTACFELREDGLHVTHTTHTMAGDKRHEKKIVSFPDLLARAEGQLTFV